MIDVLVCGIIPIYRFININAVNLIDSPNIILRICLSEQLLTITTKEKATKLNVTTNIKGYMTIRISLYNRSRVTATIYISSDVRL